MTNAEKRQKAPLLLILALWFAGLGAAGQFAKISVSFPELTTIYAVSNTQLGLIVSVVSLTGVIFGMTAAQLVSNIGFRRMLLWSMFIGAAISAVQALLPAYPVMLTSRILEGLTHLTITVCAPTLIGILSSDRMRPIFMALWSTFFSVSYAVVAWIGPDLIGSYGVGALYAVHGIYMAVIGAVLIRLVPKGTVTKQPVPSFKAIIRRHIHAYSSPNEFAPAIGWLFYTLTFVSVLTLIPQFIPPEHRTTLVPLLPLASIATSLTLGAMLLRVISAITLVQIGFISSGVFALMLQFLPYSPATYIALFACLGLVQSASFSAIPQINPTPESQAIAHGGMSQMGNLGNLLGTPVMLLVSGAFGTGGAMMMLVLCYLTGFGAHFVLAQKRRQLI